MRRSELREHIFKLLFVSEFNSPDEMPEQLSLYFEGLEELSEKDREYMEEKYAHVQEKMAEIDALFNSISKGWKTQRMNKVDLTTLRLAVYEVQYDPDVPAGVAINEAVELAKKFGGEDSRSFVNGVLGRISRIGEEPVTEEENRPVPQRKTWTDKGETYESRTKDGRILVTHQKKTKDPVPKTAAAVNAAEKEENADEQDEE